MASIQFSKPAQSLQASVIVDLMNQVLAQPDVLSLAAGFTDNSILPRSLVRQMSTALTQVGLPNEPLQYGQNQGRLGLRELSCRQLQQFPNESPQAFIAEQLFLSNGSQQALYLAMQTLCDPGSIVLVQDPTYFVFLELLQGLGIHAEAMPCDVCGQIDFEALTLRLQAMAETGELACIRAVYLVSYYANPSSHSMDLTEKNSWRERCKLRAFRCRLLKMRLIVTSIMSKRMRRPLFSVCRSGQHFPNCIWAPTPSPLLRASRSVLRIAVHPNGCKKC